MSDKKTRLNLDELKVQSFVTTIDAKEQAALYGAVETGPIACGGGGINTIRCTGWGSCGESGAYCYDTNNGCSVGSTDPMTCVPQTTYCTEYEYCEPPTYEMSCG